jgi:hypothetical protein
VGTKLINSAELLNFSDVDASIFDMGKSTRLGLGRQALGSHFFQYELMEQIGVDRS